MRNNLEIDFFSKEYRVSQVLMIVYLKPLNFVFYEWESQWITITKYLILTFNR